MSGAGVASPTASMLTLRAADKYCSRKLGDTCNTSATLSKPSLDMSGGNNSSASTCTARMSSIAFAYSFLFNLCTAICPGFEPCAAASESRYVSMSPTNVSMAFSVGLSLPGGGMSLPRSLRMAASHTAAFSGMVSGARVSNARLPAQSSVLWQSTQ